MEREITKAQVDAVCASLKQYEDDKYAMWGYKAFPLLGSENIYYQYSCGKEERMNAIAKALPLVEIHRNMFGETFEIVYFDYDGVRFFTLNEVK